MDTIKNRGLSETSALRLRAEDSLLAQPEGLPQASTVEYTQRLVHELDVHRIELEMQNASLRESRIDVESALDRYTDLYDFAPVSYFILDRKGVVLSTNLTAAALIGMERSRLSGLNFGLFIASENRADYTEFMEKLFETRSKECCEVSLLVEGRSRLYVRIEAIADIQKLECRIAVIDFSALKHAEDARREIEELNRKTLLALPAHIAVIDRQGCIIAINDAWTEFSSDNGAHGLPTMTVGADYCNVCRQGMTGQDAIDAAQALVGIESVLDGTQKQFTMEYPCHSPQQQRWFYMTVVPLGLSGESGAVITHTDISARKLAEEALRESEERFRAIASASADWIWEIDINGRYTYASDKIRNALGYQPAEIIGRTPFDLMPPVDAERACEKFQAITANHDSFRDFSNIYLHKDGEIRHVLTTGLPIFDRQGTMIGYRGIDKDITERKRADNKLRQSEERHRLLVETMLQGVVHQDDTGRIISMNPAAERILGKSCEELIGNNSVTVENDTIRENGEIFPGIDHPTMVALQTGLPVSGVIMGVFNPRLNERRWIEIDAVPVFRPGENLPSEVYSIFEDITARKQSQIDLQKSEHRIQQALHVSRSFTFDWLTATDQVIRSASCESILKLTADEAIIDTGMNYFQRIHPDDRAGFVNILNNLSTANDSYTTEYRLILDDGSRVVLEESGRGSFCADGTLERLVGVSTDITARKDAEQALQQIHEELEQRVWERTADLETAMETLQAESAERLKILEELRKNEQMLLQQSRLAAMGEMINNIAHQWRQPLNTLGLLVQKIPLLYDTAEIKMDFLVENSTKSMELIQYMSKTIDDFRFFFRSDKEIVTFGLDSAVRQSVGFIELTLKDLKIAIELHLDESLIFRGYPNEFAQALLNILLNSRDALVENNIDNAKIVLRAFANNGTSVVTVTDNAGGIPEDIIDKIFDPYFTTKSPDKGTGLGLFMSKTIIEKNMKGLLTAHNTGSGAEFRIEVAYDDK